MINEEYVNEKKIMGYVVSIDPVRFRKNRAETPVLNAVIVTKRLYGDSSKEDRHKIAIFGESAHDFNDRVRVGDYVMVHGYTFQRERKFTQDGVDVQMIEDTLCSERWIAVSALTEEAF